MLAANANVASSCPWTGRARAGGRCHRPPWCSGRSSGRSRTRRVARRPNCAQERAPVRPCLTARVTQFPSSIRAVAHGPAYHGKTARTQVKTPGKARQADETLSSATSERFVGDGRLRLSGRNDARCTGCHGIRGTRATRCHRHVRSSRNLVAGYGRAHTCSSRAGHRRDAGQGASLGFPAFACRSHHCAAEADLLMVTRSERDQPVLRRAEVPGVGGDLYPF